MEKPKTSGMKLSELRPCDNCGGPLVPWFKIIEVKLAIFGRGTRETLALTEYFGGLSRPGALAVAEAMGPSADEAIVVSEDPDLNAKLFICQKCYNGVDAVGAYKPFDLIMAIEKRNTQLLKEKHEPEHSDAERTGPASEG